MVNACTFIIEWYVDFWMFNFYAEKHTCPVVGNVPVIVRSQKKRAVGQAGNTDEISKYPVFQNLHAYHNFHDLNPKVQSH